MGQATDEAKREALAHLAEVAADDARNYARKAEALVWVADLFTGRDDPAAAGTVAFRGGGGLASLGHVSFLKELRAAAS